MKLFTLILLTALAAIAQNPPVRAVARGASDPGTCTVGDLYQNTTTPALKLCTATNTWTALGTGGSGSAVGTVFNNQFGYYQVASKNTQYWTSVSTGAPGTATEANQQMLVRVAGTIGDLRANVTGAPGTNCAATISIRKNGAASAVTITVAAGQTGQLYSTGTDTVVPGDLLSLGVIVQDSGGTCASSTSTVLYSMGARYY